MRTPQRLFGCVPTPLLPRRATLRVPVGRSSSTAPTVFETIQMISTIWVLFQAMLAHCLLNIPRALLFEALSVAAVIATPIATISAALS
jgi:hypothetical protein